MKDKYIRTKKHKRPAKSRAKYMREYRANKKRTQIHQEMMAKVLNSSQKLMKKRFDKNEATEDQLRRCAIQCVNEAMSVARETVVQLYLLNHRIGDLKRAVLAAANRKGSV